MAVRGFILHPTYRIESGRPVVHLFGRLETGESFLIRDTRVVPYFFVRAGDAGAARAQGACRVAQTDLKTMRGEPVVRVEVPTPPDTPPVRDGLLERGIPVYEADIRFAVRYLIDRGIRGAVAIDGEGAGPGDGPAAPCGRPGPAAVDRCFEDPGLRPADWLPPKGLLRLVSLDIETDPRGQRVYAVSLAGAGLDEVLLALPEERVRSGLRGARPEGAVVACGDERGLLRRAFARLREVDFDILTGWNVIDFDLSVLGAAARRYGVPFEIGRLPGAARVIRDTSFWGRSRVEVAGRLVLDGIDLLRGAFVRLEDYRLDTAARTILGEGKVALEPGAPGRSGRGRAEAIDRAFREDLPLFVAYSRTDAHLVLGILDEARLIDLSLRRSLLTGMPPDRVGASIASFDFLYLGELRRRGRVAPSVGGRTAEEQPTAGGAVLEPSPGLYENVLAFDFRSLYPSLIRTFNIDPLGYDPDAGTEGDAEVIRAPNGAAFRREPGILPEMLKDLFPRRDEAKRRGDAIGAHALKILMNSFYGVLATPACRFYSGPVANAITHFGQWVLHWARDRMESLGYRVLYGDTDSLFVLSGLRGAGARPEARRLGAELCDRINRELREQVAATWRADSHLELEFEMLLLKFFLPSVRHGKAGARKRYAGLVDGGARGGSDELLFVGMEVVRRDWTELSKIFQRGLFERLFRGATREAAAAYVREFVRALKEGRHDGHLVYRKALRKAVEEYTATTPPHVRAARMSHGRVGDLIEYVITVAGPEPAASRKSPIDYGHYVDRQVRPIAEQVLEHIGIDFDEAAGEAAQGSLF
ncbi:MAG: DNA polymerase II [Acidobacteriota bacterium]